MIPRRYAWWGPLAVLLVLLAANAHSYDDDKRADAPFLMGPRYGRSGGGGAAPQRQQLKVSPRTDRFFMGSRYGKRGYEDVPAEALDLPELEGRLSMHHREDDSGTERLQSVLKGEPTTTCIFTGITDLYRCFRR